MVKDAQVGVLRGKRMEGKTQEASAAAAGMSVRSAREWEHGPYPSQRRKPHRWRTREDPFAEVFDTEVAALLAADRNGVLEATTILAELNRRYPGQFGTGQLRTLQRRVRQWPALNGLTQQVAFEWMRAVLQKEIKSDALQREIGYIPDLDVLLRHLYDGRLSQRNRSMVILAGRRSLSNGQISSFLAIPHEPASDTGGCSKPEAARRCSHVGLDPRERLMMIP